MKGDIFIEPEGTTTSGRDFKLHQGRSDVARAAELLDLTPRQIKRLKARYRKQRSRSGTRQPQPASPRRLPEPTRARILEWPAPLCGLQRSPSLRELCEVEGFSLGPRPSAASCAPRESDLRASVAPQAPPAPFSACSGGRDVTAGRQSALLAGRSRPAATLLGFWMTPPASTRRRVLSYRRCLRLFPLAPPPVASLRRSAQLLRRSSWRFRAPR